MKYSSLTDRVKGDAAEVWDLNYLAKAEKDKGKDVIVLNKPGEAHRLGEHILDKGYRGMSRETLLIGTPAQVAEQLHPFAELGFAETVCRCMTVSQNEALGASSCWPRCARCLASTSRRS